MYTAMLNLKHLYYILKGVLALLPPIAYILPAIINLTWMALCHPT